MDQSPKTQKSLKPLNENIKETLHGIHMDNQFLTPNIEEIKGKEAMWVQATKVPHSKQNNRVKRNHTQNKIFANFLFNQGLIHIIYKESKKNIQYNQPPWTFTSKLKCFNKKHKLKTVNVSDEMLVLLHGQW